jgi:GNAT superfamily N-acetyltransferase
MTPAIMSDPSGRFLIEWFDYSTATKADMAQIGEVYKHVFEHDIRLVFNPALDADFLRPLDYYAPKVRGAFIVTRDANDGNRIVGTAALRHLKELGNQVEIKRMFFLPVCRGRKLAHIVCQLLLGRARDLGYDAVVLDTKKRLAAANRVYEVHGFRDCENYNGNPRADRFMRLRLDSAAAPPSSKL